MFVFVFSENSHAKKSVNSDQVSSLAEAENSETASIVSSPGRPQPVNFDFHRPDTLRRDPNIIQPVAVRLSPDSPVLQSSDLDDEDPDPVHRRGRRKASRGEVSYEKLWNAAGKDEHEDDENEARKLKEHKR